jgi:hypothetical protein
VTAGVEPAGALLDVAAPPAVPEPAGGLPESRENAKATAGTSIPLRVMLFRYGTLALPVDDTEEWLEALVTQPGAAGDRSALKKLAVSDAEGHSHASACIAWRGWAEVADELIDDRPPGTMANTLDTIGSVDGAFTVRQAANSSIA